MSTGDAISLGVSIGLGLLSVGLGVFAIWLSHRFAEQSTVSLEAIRDLATEMRSLIDASLSQQKDFSSRMLDSILTRDQYGGQRGAEPVPSIEETVRKGLAESEARIAAQVESQVRAIAAKSIDPGTLDQAVASIKAEIGTLATKAAETATASVTLPEVLRDELIEARSYPIRVLLLVAIAREGVTTQAQLRAVKDTYAFPDGWSGMLNRWIESGILIGTPTEFAMPDTIRRPLVLWSELNWPTIEQIASANRERTESSDDVAERREMRQIAKGLRV